MFQAGFLKRSHNKIIFIDFGMIIDKDFSWLFHKVICEIRGHVVKFLEFTERISCYVSHVPSRNFPIGNLIKTICGNSLFKITRINVKIFNVIRLFGIVVNWGSHKFRQVCHKSIMTIPSCFTKGNGCFYDYLLKIFFIQIYFTLISFNSCSLSCS